jgi:hypothetical protein
LTVVTLVTGRRTARWALRALAFALCATASVAQACPVCFSAKDEAQRQAFFDTTIFLTLLPLAMIGGVIYWVGRRSRQLEAEQGEVEARDGRQGPLAR